MSLIPDRHERQLAEARHEAMKHADYLSRVIHDWQKKCSELEAALAAERATSQRRLEILQQISREAYITWSNEVRGLKVETLRLARKEPGTGPWLDREEVDRG